MAAVIQVRNATLEDARAIASIHVVSWQATYRGHMDDAFLDTLTPEGRTQTWTRILTADASRTAVLVAETGGAIVGFCSTGPTRDPDMPETTGELYAIYVDPDETRSGIGTALIGRTEAAMCEARYDAAMLWVLRDNPNARAFYERSGWSFDGSEKQDIIAGRAITEVRYRKALNEQPDRHP